MIMNANLWHDAVVVQSGLLELTPDMPGMPKSYNLSMTLAPNGKSMTHFPLTCMQAGGNADTSCGDLATALQTFFMPAAGQMSAYSNITCQGASNGDGCDCFYNYQLTLTDKGTWGLPQNNVLAFQNGIDMTGASLYMLNGHLVQSMATAPGQAMSANFCATNNSLTLTGYQGQSLFGVFGLRTLVMNKM
jgi:hypothetical protein